MATLPSLAMSGKKDDLIKHLGLSLETYNLMADETDHVYKWLTSDKRHLKDNCKRKPPYDWSDIQERSKDEAMTRIAESGDSHTSYYWCLAIKNDDGCPNWIARWFLYHKFRYRDGRNRNTSKRDDGRQKQISSSRHSQQQNHSEIVESNGCDDETYESYFSREATSADHEYGPPATGSYASSLLHRRLIQPLPRVSMLKNKASASAGNYAANIFSTTQVSTYIQEEYDESGKSSYWDPVRDSVQYR